MFAELNSKDEQAMIFWAVFHLNQILNTDSVIYSSPHKSESDHSLTQVYKIENYTFQKSD